jgi:alanine-synthesizing transaminase
MLMSEALVAVSPGIGFGPMGEGFVRFSLIENNHRIRQATKNIGHFLQHQPELAGVRTRNV